MGMHTKLFVEMVIAQIMLLLFLFAFSSLPRTKETMVIILGFYVMFALYLMVRYIMFQEAKNAKNNKRHNIEPRRG